MGRTKSRERGRMGGGDLGKVEDGRKRQKQVGHFFGILSNFYRSWILKNYCSEDVS